MKACPTQTQSSPHPTPSLLPCNEIPCFTTESPLLIPCLIPAGHLYIVINIKTEAQQAQDTGRVEEEGQGKQIPGPSGASALHNGCVKVQNPLQHRLTHTHTHTHTPRAILPSYNTSAFSSEL